MLEGELRKNISSKIWYKLNFLQISKSDVLSVWESEKTAFKKTYSTLNNNISYNKKKFDVTV